MTHSDSPSDLHGSRSIVPTDRPCRVEVNPAPRIEVNPRPSVEVDRTITGSVDRSGTVAARRARPVCRVVYVGPGPRLLRLDVTAAEGAPDVRAQLRALYRSGRAVADLVAAGHLDHRAGAVMLAYGTVAAGWHRTPGAARVLAAGLRHPRRIAGRAG